MAKKSDGVRASGAGYRYRIRYKGKEYSETIPGHTKSARAEAVKRREQLLAQIKSGYDIDAPKSRLFKDVAEEYLDTLDVRDNTLKDYYLGLKKWMVLGNKPLEAITTADIKKVLSSWNVGVSTKRARLRPLYGVFNYAEVPYPRIRFKKHQKPEIDRYTPEERELLLSKLEGQAKVFFSVLFGCGLRPGEALALEWTDYDGEYLRVTKTRTRRKIGPTKTGARRKVYVPTWVRPILNGHSTRFAGEHIFTGNSGRPVLDTDQLSIKWRAAHRKARLPYRVPYTCRHTRAAELLSVGVLPAAAAKQLGHSTKMFLDTYSEFIEEYSDQDMSLLEGVKNFSN